MRRCCLALFAVVAVLSWGTVASARIVVGSQLVDVGGIWMAGDSHQLGSSLGQTAVGIVGGPEQSYVHHAGFWYRRDWYTAVPNPGEENGDLPAPWLGPNRPNPFNPSTSIVFAVPRTQTVSLRVYDLAGRVVRNLVEADVAAGTHTVTFDGLGLASGVYVVRFVTDGVVQTEKLTLVR